MQYYQKYILEHPDYEFAGIYADEGISGTDLRKREAFKRMMEDARNGKIDMILTKSLSRFGRNTIDTLQCVRQLRELKVDIYFEKENIHTINSEGELLITLISAVAQSESQAQSQNVKWGIHKQYERGNIKSIPSGKFLGYDKDENGNLVINEAQAAIVRRIYREFLAGFGSYQIAKRLTAEKVPMAYGGKAWCPSHIRKVLTNEKMKGDTRFQKTYNSCYLTKKRKKNSGKLPQHYFENTHDAIIDKYTWALVQLELERQSDFAKAHHIDVYHRHSEQHPLSCKIFCSTCGSSYMVLVSKRLGDEGRRYWRCSSFVGRQGTIIKGKTFTPKPHHRKSTIPSVIRRRKDPMPREMFCTDIQVDGEAPKETFVKAWNHLVDYQEHYLPEWQQIIDGDDILKAYRTKELMRMLEETGYIETMPYELMLKTLDHIEIDIDGKVDIIFLAGMRFKG